MRPWIVGGVAAIVLAMLVFDYARPVSTTAASAPSSRSSSTTTGAAPLRTVNPTAATAAPAPSTSVPENDPPR